MNEDRPADVMYSEPATEAPHAAKAPERDFDALWPADPTPKPREPRVVARAIAARSAGEVMYDDAPATEKAPAPEHSPASENKTDGDTKETADAKEEVPAPRDLIEVLPGLHVHVPSDGRFTHFDQQGLDQMAPIVDRYAIEAPAVQELFDLHLKQLEQESADAQHALIESMTAEHEARVDEWRAACKSDPEIARYGVKEAAAHGKATLKQFFPKEFRDTLQEYGLLNHPGLVKGLLRVRKATETAIQKRLGYL